VVSFFHKSFIIRSDAFSLFISSLDALGQSGWVPRLAQQVFLWNRLGRASEFGRDDRKAGLHRFQDRPTERLRPDARMDEYVCFRIRLGDFLVRNITG
jgi:hypothetical protein